jgi:hypothetical protein
LENEYDVLLSIFVPRTSLAIITPLLSLERTTMTSALMFAKCHYQKSCARQQVEAGDLEI